MFSEYDPIMGIGSPLDRFPVFFYKHQKTALMLPIQMQEVEEIKAYQVSKLRSIEEYTTKQGIQLEPYLNAINEKRLDYDFEFWAFIAIQIKNKDGGKNIPFKLNNGQKKLVKTFMDMFWRDEPIRVILLKSRQWGGSTLTQIFMLWIQVRHMTNWNSLIAAHIKTSAITIRTMLKKALENYAIEKLSLVPFEGTTNVKLIKERSNKITVGSMETPDSIRGDDIAMAHLSEVGLWKKTEGKK